MTFDWNERLVGVVVALESVFSVLEPGAASMCSCPACPALLCSLVNVVVADGAMTPEN